jgi:hypothetical protein
MRWLRPAATSILVVIVVLAAGWRFSAPHARPAAVSLGRVAVPQALRRRLEQYLALSERPPGRPAPVPPLRLFRRGAPSIRPGVPLPATCYVAAGACSLTPCVQFVRVTSATAVAHAGAPAAGAGCQRRLAVPKIVRVAAP